MPLYCYKTIVGNKNTTVLAAADTLKLFEKTVKKFLTAGKAEYACSVAHPNALEILTNNNVSGFKMKVLLFKHNTSADQEKFIEHYQVEILSEQGARNRQNMMIERHEFEKEAELFKSDVRTIAEIKNDEENGIDVIRVEYKAEEDKEELLENLKEDELIVYNSEKTPMIVASATVHEVSAVPASNDFASDNDDTENEEIAEDVEDVDDGRVELEERDIEILLEHREMLTRLIGRDIDIMVDGVNLDTIINDDAADAEADVDFSEGAVVERTKKEETEEEKRFYTNSKDFLPPEMREKLRKCTLQDLKAALVGAPVDSYGRPITEGKTQEEIDRELGMSEDLIQIRKTHRELVEEDRRKRGLIHDLSINIIDLDKINKKEDDEQ